MLTRPARFALVALLTCTQIPAAADAATQVDTTRLVEAIKELNAALAPSFDPATTPWADLLGVLVLGRNEDGEPTDDYAEARGIAPPPHPRFHSFLESESELHAAAWKHAGRHAWTAEEQPDLAAWLAATRPTLEVVVAALRREPGFLPWVLDESVDGPLQGPPENPVRKLGEALVVRANFRLGAGDALAWAEGICEALDVADLIAEQGTETAMLNAMALRSGAQLAVREALTRPLPAAGAAARVGARLGEAQPPLIPRLLGQVSPTTVKIRLATLLHQPLPLDVEMLEMLHSEVGGPRHPPPPAPPDDLVRRFREAFDPERAAARIDTHAAAMLAAWNDPDRDAAADRLDSLNEATWAARDDRRPIFEQLTTERDAFAAQINLQTLLATDTRAEVTDRLTDVSLARYGPTSASLWPKHFRLIDAIGGLTRVAAALRAWEEKRGVLPDSLGEMVPEFLDRVPADSDGAPLRYRRTENGFLLWSVGDDAADDGGTGTVRVVDEPGLDVVLRGVAAMEP